MSEINKIYAKLRDVPENEDVITTFENILTEIDILREKVRKNIEYLKINVVKQLVYDDDGPKFTIDHTITVTDFDYDHAVLPHELKVILHRPDKKILKVHTDSTDIEINYIKNGQEKTEKLSEMTFTPTFGRTWQDAMLKYYDRVFGKKKE